VATKLYDSGLSPEPLRASGTGNERAVPASFGRQKGDEPVPGHGRVVKGFERNERIILRRHDDSRHTDLSDHAKRARLAIVLGGISVAARGRRNGFVPFTQGAQL